MNKYQKWYNNIVANGKTTRFSGYERHHILPKSLGGSDHPSNIVYITPREHFICHWLLYKIHTNGIEHWKMINALRIMKAENNNQKRYETKITSRVYEKLKQEYSRWQSEKHANENNPFYGKKHTYEVRQKIKEANLGEKNGSKRSEVRKKISESKLGKKRKPFSQEWLDNLSKNHRSKKSDYDGSHSEETKQKIREKAIGRKQSPQTIAKKAEAIRGIKREKKLCQHCNKEVAVNGYARWHGSNCKEKR